MIYIYIWYDCCGWSHDMPTEEDIQTIESGDLLVLEVVGGEIPRNFDTKDKLQKCLTDETPDGAEYHYVP